MTSPTTPDTALTTVQIDGRTITYRELGDGPAVLLLHGWPTSSFMWRHVMPAIARRNRVVAIDLPGFGGSDKPLDVRYDFGLFEAAIDGLLDALGIERVALGVHDLGGPVGIHWALDHRERVTGLALLNTLVYPELSDATVEFVTTLGTPERRESLTSPDGLVEIMRLGLADEANLTDDLVAAIRAPFTTADHRTALALAGIGLPLRGLADIAARLDSLRTVPLRIIYGEHDRVLPDVADTMARVSTDLPQAVTTVLPYGHFLLEEAPEEAGALLADFFATTGDAS